MTATWEIREGDALERLREMPDGSVQCCVTSPPYFGLRDYGTGEWEGGEDGCDHKRETRHQQQGSTSARAGRANVEDQRNENFRDECGKCGARRVDRQIGLESTPDEFVARLVEVFREVRRVLRPDGTLWLNIGSSYASQDGYPITPTDAAWLAGLIDGEGCIQIHRQRKPSTMNSVDSFQIDLSVGMMDREAVERAYAITSVGSCHQQNRGVWDWSVRGQQTATLLRALYPFLTVKKRRAAYAIMLAEDLASQKFGRGNPATDEAMAYRQAIKEAVSALNQRQETTLPMREPKVLPVGVKAKDDLMIPAQLALALRADGWYLRSEIVWAKSNPMPESVQDRPTSAHEKVFLLAKSARYFWDADAIREANRPYGVESPMVDGGITERTAEGPNGRQPILQRGRAARMSAYNPAGRNKRNVWEIATQPYPGAHFAVFPSKLVEPMILAGSSPKACGECGAPWVRVVERVGLRDLRVRGANGEAPKHDARIEMGLRSARSGLGGSNSHSDASPQSPEVRTTGWQPSCPHDDDDTGHSVILDPFAGAGTTGLVALRHDRSFIGIELSPAYAEMARERIRDDQPLFNWQSEASAAQA